MRESLATSHASERAAYRQTCKVCGRPDKFDFGVPDEEWVEIVPLPYRGLVVCLSCFDLFAVSVGKQYALTRLTFVGDQGVFEFEVRRVA